MESEINIQNLPDDVLEKIFSYSSNKKNLRLVSKRFCDIVNLSPRLMSKFTLWWLKKENINNIRGRYQNLKFNNVYSNDVEFIKQYNYKQFVKNIHFDIDDIDFGKDSDFEQTFELIKSVLSEFDQMLDIQLDFDWSDADYWSDYLCLVLSLHEFSNIRCLKIESDMRVLSLFRNAPNLKKLNIESVSGKDFIQPINWQLKELDIKYLDCNMLDAFVKFLETQRSTLTTLKINCWPSILNDIVHKLPNLNVLHLQVSEQDYINDEWLLPNDKLKELAIINSYTNGGLLEQILKHYRSVEKLYIHVDETFKIEHELRLANIKHLTVTEQSFGILKYLRSGNLTSLTLIGEKIGKFDDVPKDILSKVETLKVKFTVKPEILDSFPALRHLYLMFTNYDDHKERLEILLINALKSTNLKYINLYEYNWKLSVSPQEFLSQKGYPDTIIKLRANFERDWQILFG